MHKHQQLLEPQESHPNHNVGFLQPCLRMLQQYLKLQVLRRLKELCPQSQVRRHQPAVAVMMRNVLWCCCIWLDFFGSNPPTETGQRWSKRGYSSDYKGIWEAEAVQLCKMILCMSGSPDDTKSFLLFAGCCKPTQKTWVRGQGASRVPIWARYLPIHLWTHLISFMPTFFLSWQEKHCHMVLQSKWFKAISDGVKTHEMRAWSPFWQSRLSGATHLVFSHGCFSESFGSFMEMLVLLCKCWIVQV